MVSIQALKKQLMAKSETSELFAGMSRPDSIGAIFGNLDKTVFGWMTSSVILLELYKLLAGDAAFKSAMQQSLRQIVDGKPI